MILQQYYIECLSQASYLVPDETTGRAIVVEPRRDVGDYLADARQVRRADRRGHQYALSCRLCVRAYGNCGEQTFPPELHDLVQVRPRITATELDCLLAANAVALIDIRSPAERESGTIAGAIPILLAQLRARLAEVPLNKPIVVHCRGWRSSAAASLMRANGFDDVCDLAGGYDEWTQAQRIRAEV